MKTNKNQVVKSSLAGLLTAAFLCLSLPQAHAATTVASWDFTSTFAAGTAVNVAGTPVAPVSAANLNGTITTGGTSTITRVANGGQAGAYMQFNPRTSRTGEPMQFTLRLTTSASASQFTISYYARVSAATGSDINTWAYSLNSGTTWTAFTSPTVNTTTTWTQYTVSQNVSVGSGAVVWFRNTLTGATANNINAEFDTIAITAVPEPVNVALGVFGLCAVVGGVARRYLRNRS